MTPARRWTWPVGSTGCARRSTAPAATRSLVTHLTNIRYLTGFTGSAAVLLVQPDALTFVTDGRYEEQAAGQLAGRGRRGRHRDRSDARPPAGAHHRAGPVARARLGLEAEHVSWASQRRYARGVVRRRRARRPPRARGGAPPREGRRRGGAHRGGVRHRRRRPRRGRAHARGRAHRAGVRARPRHRDAPPGRRRHQLRHDRRGRPERLASPPLALGSRASSAATSSSSTSAPSSTATTPT